MSKKFDGAAVAALAFCGSVKWLLARIPAEPGFEDVCHGHSNVFQIAHRTFGG
jgi:hypothetical protein